MKTSSVPKKTNKRVIIGLSGGIAAYKTVELVRALQKEGASIKVIMTEASKRFISPLVFETLTNEPVFDDIFQYPLDHIKIASEADLFVIAPATANTIAKLASGVADNPLCLTLLAFRGPVLVVPAMNNRMYEHPLVQKNIRTLKEIGYLVMEPETGELACGYEGKGRMPSIEKIMSEIRLLLSDKDLKGLKILVTAGPTRELIDPVRYISNRSSGKMGYAIAEVAMQKGAEVVLVSGPTWLSPPSGAKTIKVETTEQMYRAVMENLSWADVVIMAAAVSDFTVENRTDSKLPKSKFKTLKLKPTTDILKSITERKKRPFVVGFAAETGPNLAKV
ncbi:MAG: bifunctional phosphopantothenoylcysteine decarboxylase/phosphopantothenate--cysteine ligase CoaBC, partial [Nitrospirae bacterium]